jgi:hypothetical protein
MQTLMINDANPLDASAFHFLVLFLVCTVLVGWARVGSVALELGPRVTLQSDCGC